MTISRRDDGELSRREFSIEALTTLFAGVVITVTACSDDEGSSLVVGPGGGTDVSGSISANHGHVATVTSVELAAGNTVALNIRGMADHPHTVTLSAAEVVQIRDRQRVTTTSTNDPSSSFGTHSHAVTFN